MLLPTLSSEDEEEYEEGDEENDDINDDFVFYPETLIISTTRNTMKEEEENEEWSSYQRKHNMMLLAASGNDEMNVVERTKVSNIIAAARNNLLKQQPGQSQKPSSSASSSSSFGDDDESSTASSSSEEEQKVDDAPHIQEQDVLKSKTLALKKSKNDDGGSNNFHEAVTGTEDTEEDDEAEKEEEAKKSAYFDDFTCPEEEQIVQFSQFALSRPLLRAIAAMGYVSPTPIQQNCIPVALAGRDICASAVTGSGKTAAFLLPIIEKILLQKCNNSAATTRALILSPTRELAAQSLSMLVAFSRFILPRDFIRGCLIVGGAKNVKSQSSFLKSRPDVVVATPGRLLDHLINSTGFSLDDLQFLVLDEADRLLELGFADEIQEIIKLLPTSNEKRQTMLFSATLADTKVDDLIRLSLKRPVRIAVSSKTEKKAVEVAPRLEQEFVRIRLSQETNREAILLSLLTRTYHNQRLIVFFDTKNMAHRFRIVAGLLGLQCEELHGDLTQPQRLEALHNFREGQVNVLLATDLIGRGIDVPNVDAVINYDMPNQIANYIHRIGRTARAGRGGKSCTLIGEGRRHLMKEVMKDAEQKNKAASVMERKILPTEKSSENIEKIDPVVAIIRSRTVPPAVIAHYAAKISSLESTIKEVLAAEKIAKLDRLAEMEAIRAENIIKHNDEIMARPAREWYISSSEKQRIEEMRDQEEMKKTQHLKSTPADDVSGKHRMSRKKRRAREAREALMLLKAEQEVEFKDAASSFSNKVMTDNAIKASAKAQKKSLKEQKDGSNKRSVHDEDIQEDRLKQKKKLKGVLGSDAPGDSRLFDEEKIAFAGKHESKPVPSAYDFRGYDPEKKFGKGGKKGHSSFKSKKKYKRRK